MSDTSVKIGSDTLVRLIGDPFTFKKDNSYAMRLNYAMLKCNKADGSLTYIREGKGSAGGAYIELSTGAYNPDPGAVTYTRTIPSSVQLAGSYTLHRDYGISNDSTSSVSLNVAIEVIDDQTLRVTLADSSYTGELHLKSMDKATNTVVYQNFHTIYCDLATLSYNTATKAITLERDVREVLQRYNMKLQ